MPVKKYGLELTSSASVASTLSKEDLTLQTPQQTYPRHWHLPQAAWLGVLAWGGIVTVELTIMRKWEYPMTRNRMEAYQALAGLLKMLNFELPTETWSQNVFMSRQYKSPIDPFDQ